MTVRDELRTRRSMRAARKALEADLASYTSTELDDLEATLERYEDDEVADLRRLIGARRVETLMSSASGRKTVVPPRPAVSAERPQVSDPHGTDPHDTKSHGTDPHGTEPYGTDPHGTEPHDTKAHGTEPYRTEPYGTERYRTEPHGTEAVLGVLEAARAIVASGWMQGDYFLVRTRGGRISSVGPLSLVSARRADIVGACLIGALTAAARRNDARLAGGSHLRAIDVTWDALQELSGRPAPVTGPGSSPAERAVRVRDLTRWNDAPARQPQDVVHLIDTAISRTIMTAVER